MGEAQELQVICIMGDQEGNAANADDRSQDSQLTRRTSINRWLRIMIYAFLVIGGQSINTLLGRLYFSKGGKSKWLATVVQLAGFPILLPFYLIPASRNIGSNPTPTAKMSPIPSKAASSLALGLVYVSLGLLVALECFLYSVGLSYLPVSTYSLICSSNLAFNALFSYFLNSQKFTPYIVNALVLLTVSSSLLVVHGSDSADGVSNESPTKYAIGFICTVGASAVSGLMLSLTQLAFTKVIKKETFRAVMDMIVCQSVVAMSATLVGLFGSGEWKGLKAEMEGFELGKAAYVLDLSFAAVIWQLYAIGSIGLIFEASSLFANAISAMGLPIVPVLAVIFFHDKMDGIKGITMVLAIWGFISYGYQHYLDDRNSEEIDEDENGSCDDGVSKQKD